MVLSEKHELLRNLYRQFAETEFTSDILDELDATNSYNWDIHHKMVKAGLFGCKIPVEYGGQGSDNLAYALMVEELSRVSPVLALYANTPNSLGAGPILQVGTDEQCKKYLTPSAKGEKIICFAITEPGAGSDAGGTTTTAIQDGDDFILNGRKCFISGAPIADYAIIFAKTDLEAKGSRGISCFIVDMKLPGISLGKDEDKMGIRGYPTGDIIMEDVRVSGDCLLGDLHKGFAQAMVTLDGGRLGVAAQSLGIGQACLEEAIKFAKDRKQFGRRIADFQAISFMLADMATEVAAARELTYNAAVLKDKKDPGAPQAVYMAKYYASEMCNRVAAKALQIHGGYGFVKDYKIERLYRDARITTIYEGTSQVQQMVISAALLK